MKLYGNKVTDFYDKETPKKKTENENEIIWQ